MARRGQVPTPKHILRLRGSKHAKGRGEAFQPRPGRPRCPGWLDGEAKRLWRELVPELEAAGVLTVVDGGALACLCEAWGEFRRLTELLRQEGPLVTGSDGRRVAHPAITLRRGAWKAYKDFSALFGLDPTNRARLSVPADVEDELAEFLIKKG